MSEIVLKPAGKEDVAVLHGLLEKLAAHLGKSDYFTSTPALLEQFGFGDAPFFDAIIAWRGEGVLGFILFFREFSTWRGRPGIYVQDIYVSPEARGLGLGRRLTGAAIRKGMAYGAVYLRLAVNSDNASGVGFYEANGFERVGDEVNMMLEGTAFEDMANEVS